MEDPLYIVDRADAIFAQADGRGTERVDDIFDRLEPHHPVLFSAPHATVHHRKKPDSVEREPKPAEGPTGGMVTYLAVEHGFSALAMVGSQMGDPNWDSDHIYKDWVERHAESGGLALFDIHGCTEQAKYDITLGLGGLPGLAEGFLARLCRDVLGPRYGFEVGHSPNYTAISPSCITTHAQKHGMVALQLELKPPLRHGDDRDARLNALMFLRDLGVLAAEKLPELLRVERSLDSSINELLRMRGPLVLVQ